MSPMLTFVVKKVYRKDLLYMKTAVKVSLLFEKKKIV